MAKPFAVDFVPNPLQKSFIESRAKADLFSSRAGEGKSTALAWSIFYHTRNNPGARWAIIRDTYENLQRSTMKTFFEWFPPGIAGTYHSSKKEFTWASGLAEGTASFIGIEDPKDASKLLSWELGGIAMDEPAPAVGSAGIDEMVFDLGLTRLRQPNMGWYPMKLATNNPDESHWTYQKFAGPQALEGAALWQPSAPENIHNLPADYYEQMRKTLAHRPDLVRRFVDGEFGFQQEGKAVTPQWNDAIHLANGLHPIPGEVTILWDFGHNPTAIFTQKSQLGHWLILDSLVGDGIGVAELIEDGVKPLLAARYGRRQLKHIGDPAGVTGEQTSIKRSAVGYIRRELGGTWRSGPVRIHERVEPLRSVLSRTVGGRGVVQVDRHRAKEVHHALRGGWHYHVSRTGVTGMDPKKNEHSHPGDAMGYGAALLFPMGRMSLQPQGGLASPQASGYFSGGGGSNWRIGPTPPSRVPSHGEKL